MQANAAFKLSTKFKEEDFVVVPGYHVTDTIKRSMRKTLDSHPFFEKCLVMKALLSMALEDASEVELSSYSYHLKVRISFKFEKFFGYIAHSNTAK